MSTTTQPSLPAAVELVLEEELEQPTSGVICEEGPANQEAGSKSSNSKKTRDMIDSGSTPEHKRLVGWVVASIDAMASLEVQALAHDCLDQFDAIAADMIEALGDVPPGLLSMISACDDYIQWRVARSIVDWEEVSTLPDSDGTWELIAVISRLVSPRQHALLNMYDAVLGGLVEAVSGDKNSLWSVLPEMVDNGTASDVHPAFFKFCLETMDLYNQILSATRDLEYPLLSPAMRSEDIASLFGSRTELDGLQARKRKEEEGLERSMDILWRAFESATHKRSASVSTSRRVAPIPGGWPGCENETDVSSSEVLEEQDSDWRVVLAFVTYLLACGILTLVALPWFSN